jgi:hypothetical protein
VEWGHMAQGRDQQQILVGTLIKLLIP